MTIISVPETKDKGLVNTSLHNDVAGFGVLFCLFFADGIQAYNERHLHIISNSITRHAKPNDHVIAQNCYAKVNCEWQGYQILLHVIVVIMTL